MTRKNTQKKILKGSLCWIYNCLKTIKSTVKWILIFHFITDAKSMEKPSSNLIIKEFFVIFLQKIMFHNVLALEYVMKNRNYSNMDYVIRYSNEDEDKKMRRKTDFLYS